jgi:hypothetical protein
LSSPSTAEQAYVAEIEGLLRDLTACLKIMTLYPDSHPAVGPAAERAFSALHAVLTARGPLHLGVSEDEIVFYGEDDTEYRSPGDLAKRLHGLEILTVQFEPDLTQEETGAFIRLLSKPPQRTEAEIPFDRYLAEAQISHITVRLVDYRKILRHDGSNVSDAQAGDFWNALIQKARKGSNNAILQLADSLKDMAQFKPLHSELQNNLKAVSGGMATADHAKIFSELHQTIYKSLSEKEQEKFASNLAVIALTAEEDDAETLEALSLSFLEHPDKMLLQILTSAIVKNGKVDNRIAAIFQELLQEAPRAESLAKSAQYYSQAQSFQSVPPEVWNQVRELILAGCEAQFMSDDYHQVLDGLSRYNLDDLGKALDRDYLDQVQAAMDPAGLHLARRNLLPDMVVLEDRTDAYEPRVKELAATFMDHARRGELATIYEQLKRIFLAGIPISPEKQNSIDSILFSTGEDSWAGFLLQASASMLPKELALLKEIVAFNKRGLADRMINDLADEPSLSGRRRISSLLVRLGKDAVPSLVSALQDQRWYVVRNVVMILGKIGDPSCTDGLAPVLGHGHVQVKREVLNSLSVLGGDSCVVAIRLVLLNRTGQAERELQLAAARALHRINTPKARKVLHDGLKDKNKIVQRVCRQVLKG